MDALFVSTALVALAEIGDKTQLLALLLAARFKKPWPIIAGIVVATILNHALAGVLGNWLAEQVSVLWLNLSLAACFLAVAGWTLIPDKLDDEPSLLDRYGAFLATLVAFFIAEMGDKTQVATVMLAAQYSDLVLVIIGTTGGMLLANVPVIWLGNRAANNLPLHWIRRAAAVFFLLMACYALWRAFNP
ncbi:TMEM165/GDT1 family protein [Atopomonas sediminilitoris]|uniref:TMEM165/GDT1 family protein n=1 Tax=Atopomonas sediminilitoris TaxID=2919919 RepID=UPI001F4D39B1|nr:TMEM165/GDT1 family protein [Atopomonas sediminilitoris]MCJ8169993.1 TMEM165/GDT1 family protein [Atopomonas sediminilitoris]